MSDYYDFDGDTLVVQFLRPVDFEGLKQTTVTLRELTVEETIDLEKVGGSLTSIEQDVRYFAKMAGKPPSFFASLKERDFKRIKNAYWKTLGNVDQPLESSE